MFLRTTANSIRALGAITFATTLAGPGSAQVIERTPLEPSQVLDEAGPDVRFLPPDLQIQGPGHPPIEQIGPIPMPRPGIDGLADPDGPRSSMFHNVLTGATVELPEMPATRAGWGLGGEQFTGISPFPDASDEMVRGFGSMSRMTGPHTSFPRSANVKVIARFRTTDGTNVFGEGSGTLIDAQTVLTAAHVVYSRDPAINDWAEEIWVYPGWDGIGPIGDPFADTVINHWGWARGTWFLAGSDYINNGNYDRDCGLIGLTDRSVGVLTGWYGWAWGGDCGPIQDLFYYNYSYPAAACGEFGLHNGRDMYLWDGTIDSCPGNQLRINTQAGCLTRGWPGMSGSSLYYISDNSRYAHGVISNGNDNFTNSCKLWEVFSNDILSFSDDLRGTTFDVESLMYRVSGNTTVKAGNSIPAGAVYIANATNANPSSRDFTLRHYLSTNNNISGADYRFSTLLYSGVDFQPMQTYVFNVPGAEIPFDTPSGTYWVGVELDPGSDANSNNNDTDTWDAQRIVVDGVSNLRPLSLHVSPSSIAVGQVMNTVFSVRNDGGDHSGAFIAEIRASTNATISTSDPLLATFAHSGISGATSNTYSHAFGLTESLAPGLYYIGVLIVDADDEIQGDNTFAATTLISIVGASDVSIDAFAVESGRYFVSDSFSIAATISNNGSAPTGPIDGRLRLSTDGSFDDADPIAASFDLDAVQPGATTSAVTLVDLEDDLEPGQYFVQLELLPTLNEMEFGNNALAASGTIEIAVCPGDLNHDGTVNIADLNLVLGSFLQTSDIADATGDGFVDMLDLNMVLGNMHAVCAFEPVN